jgi:hypothetical protein
MASLAKGLAPAASAVVAGTGLVGLVASYISDNAAVPKFSLDTERFDQSTFLGRVKRFMVASNPSTLFVSDEEALAARGLLQKYARGEAEGIDDKTLWKARELRDTCFGSEPDSEDAEIVPRPFRMTGYVPFNGPIIVAMTLAQSSPAIIGWHIVNQTQNALVNYHNRNRSAPFSMRDLISSYAIAVSASVGVAFGLSFIIKRKCPPEKVAQLLRFVAFPSCVVASSANCYIMRSPEIKGGWQLRDKSGNVAAGGEHSRVAAKQGVYQTAATRALLQIPSILLPVLFTAIPAVSTLIAVNPVLNLPITTFVCLSCFGIGLPLSLSAFPQIVAISPAKLEPNFRSYYGDDELLFYNRGL